MQRQRLGEMLLERGHVLAQDLEQGLRVQASVGGRLGAILVRIGALSEDLLLDTLSLQLDMPVVVGESLPSIAAVVDFVRASAVPFDWFVDQAVLMSRVDERTILCLARDPLHDALQQLLPYQFPEDTIRFALARNQDLDRLLELLEREKLAGSVSFGDDDARQLRELAEQAPVIELVSNVMSQAIDANASDIHIEPRESDFIVRFRVDGILQSRLTQPKARFSAVASRIKLISGIDIAERRLPQDGRVSTRVSGKDMDVRVSTVPGVHGESIVMRLLPKEREDLGLQRLGMEPDHLAMLQRWLGESHGIVLVTGPTGSGKSTTLYGALAATNDGCKKIITVEDPVEFQVPGITQIQAHAEIGYTFARALRAILRQDPDVIMIGEIRDRETAEIAIQSALTGHLVLSTLHTNDAVGSFTRLIDMGIEPFLVSAPMKGVQAQRLVRRLCGHCAVPEAPPESILAEVAAIPGDYRPASAPRWLKAVGCPRCQNSGYRGRLGIYEMVDVTPAVQELITRNAPLHEIRQQAVLQGARTLRQDGLFKAWQGVTSLEEVLRVTSEH